MLEVLDKKDATWWRILSCAIALDISHGHQKWSYTQLAKSANVSRSIIYHYFGQKKEEILLQACHMFGQYLAGNTPKQIEYYKQKQFASGIKVARDLFKKYPTLLQFYWLHRNQKNDMGKLIKRYERLADKKRKDFFPQLTDANRNLLQAIQMGLAIYPDLADESLVHVNRIIDDICSI
jgi:AcrR family transcriptional regulator